jgi:hypothetical protein
MGIVIVAAAVGVAYANIGHSSGQASISTSITSIANASSKSCPNTCALWTKQVVPSEEALAISQDDSFAVAGENNTVTAYNDEGNLLWSFDTNHVISSVSISSNGRYVAAGGWQIVGGCSPNLNISGPHSCPAAIYSNGEIYLFNSTSGKLLWSFNTGSSSPVWKVELSGNGSFMGVLTENILLFLDSAGKLLWNYSATGTGINNTGPGNFFGMDMSNDASFIVASVGYIQTDQANFMWEFVALDSGGHVLWNYSAADGQESGAVALSTDGSSVWASSAYSGWNGTIYFFNRQGMLLWHRQIYSPALSIQSGDNMSVLVATNWGALLYGGDGSLLENYSSSSSTVNDSSGCGSAVNYWYWSGGTAPISFMDPQGDVVTSYAQNGSITDAQLSPDGHYALIASSAGNSANYLYFLSLNGSQYCEQP